MPYVFGLWGVKLVVELVGMHYGERQMGRRDLGGLTTLTWAVLHPFFIATVVLWSLIKSGEWRAGANSYRRRFAKRQWREWWRKVRGGGIL